MPWWPVSPPSRWLPAPRTWSSRTSGASAATITRSRELDIPPGRLGKLGVAENTEREHNIVVCTLCSCYPHDLLGDPPWWYRTEEYKRRIIEDPRAMLAEMFGLQVPPHRAIVVRDSTSDVRWMVLPRQPEGSQDMTEEQLADLVTPESLVGAAEPRTPPDPA